MEYRKIGKTEMQASVIGLGCEHLDGKPYSVVEETVYTALDGGVNILDVFMPGDTIRRDIGKALGARRKDVFIQGHIGSVDLRDQYDISRDPDICKRYFEQLLSCLGTDYIDFGMLFFIDSQEAFDDVFHSDILRYAQDLKRQGVVRALGASSHNPIIARKVVETGLVDVLLFSVNPVFDMLPATGNALEHLDGGFAQAPVEGIDPTRAELYRVCAQQGVSITVMKTLGAGKLLDAGLSPFGKAMSVGQCIHYALTRPAVASTMIGAASRQQMLDALAYLDMDAAARDYTDVLHNRPDATGGSCVYCNHCLPCPADIDIASVHRLLDVARLDAGHIPAETRAAYKALEHRGKDCIACGHCEGRCPFGIPVIRNMGDADRLLEG